MLNVPQSRAMYLSAQLPLSKSCDGIASYHIGKEPSRNEGSFPTLALIPYLYIIPTNISLTRKTDPKVIVAPYAMKLANEPVYIPRQNTAHFTCPLNRRTVPCRYPASKKVLQLLLRDIPRRLHVKIELCVFRVLLFVYQIPAGTLKVHDRMIVLHQGAFQLHGRLLRAPGCNADSIEAYPSVPTPSDATCTH